MFLVLFFFLGQSTYPDVSVIDYGFYVRSSCFLCTVGFLSGYKEVYGTSSFHEAMRKLNLELLCENVGSLYSIIYHGAKTGWQRSI